MFNPCNVSILALLTIIYGLLETVPEIVLTMLNDKWDIK